MKVPGSVIVGVVVGLIFYGMAGGDRNAGTDTEPVAGITAEPGSSSAGSSGNGRSGGSASESGSPDSGSGGSSASSGAGDSHHFPDTGGATLPDIPQSPLGEPSGVTLTFDDGPHPVHTPQILDLLAAHDASAVFCVVGHQVRKHPDLLRRIVDEGHALCNHTFSHDHHLAGRPRADVAAEIAQTQEAVADAVPHAQVTFFRQPGTYVTADVAPVIADHGLAALDWSLDPRDWARPGASVIVQRIVDGLEPGSVILLHDGGGDRTQTVRAVAQLLPALHDAGYRTVLPASS